VVELLNGSEETITVIGFDIELELKRPLHTHLLVVIHKTTCGSTGKVIGGEAAIPPHPNGGGLLARLR
jgi:hypothetical protein